MPEGPADISAEQHALVEGIGQARACACICSAEEVIYFLCGFAEATILPHGQLGLQVRCRAHIPQRARKLAHRLHQPVVCVLAEQLRGPQRTTRERQLAETGACPQAGAVVSKGNRVLRELGRELLSSALSLLPGPLCLKAIEC